jgi:PAS domain S-box-containing protein
MTAPTTLPDALVEIEGLRGQVRELLRLFGKDAQPSDLGVSESPASTTVAREFSEGLVPKQAGKETAQHLRDLHQVIETIPDVIFKLDLQGNLVGWNKRLETVTGFTPQELSGRPALSFVPEHEHAQTAAAIRRAFEEGYAELEGHMLTKDGRTIPYHWTGASLKNEAGRVIGITGVGRDVSEKKRIQAEFQRQRQLLLSAQALAHVGSWEWEIASGNMKWSEEQFRIFGHEPGAIPAAYGTFIAAVMPDDHLRVVTAIETALKGMETLDIEYRIVCPNGEIRSIHCRGEITCGHAGHPTRVTGSTLDVTERRQAELDLRLSEAHFRALIEQSSDIITVLGPDGTIKFESPSFERLLGYKQHEIDGRIVFDFIHPEDLLMVLEKFQQVVQQPGESQSAEFRFRHKDGSWRSFEGIGRATFDAEGQLLVIANSRDITERRRAQEALTRSYDLLNSFVEHTPGAVAMLDKDLRYVAVSRRWIQDYRLGEQDLIGRNHYDIFPEIRSNEAWQAVYRRCLSGAVERREEDRFVRADGSEDWLKWEVRPWEDVTGDIGGIIIFTEVITERKQADEALRLSEERYARATAIGKVGVWELDPVTGLYYGDANLKHLFGYESDELSTDPYEWLRLVHPEDQSIALKAWEGIVSGSTDDYYYELRMIRKDGTLIWTDVRGHAERDEHGRLQRLIGATVDITERKQADTALRISQMKLRQALEASNTGLWDWNTATNEVMFSAEWKRQLGYEETELPDNFESWESRMHPDDRARAVAYAMRYRDNPAGAFRLDFRLLHKDGTYRWIDSHASFVAEPDGRRVRLFGSHTDITDRKQAEETLSESEARFRTLVSNIPGAIYRCAVDGEWTMSYLSNAIEDIVGYPAAEFVGNHTRSYASVIHPDDRQLVEGTVRAGLRGRCPYVLEYRVIHANGTVRWVYEKGQGVFTPDGEVRFLDGAIFDITERTRTESELQRSHTFLRQVIDTTPNFIFARDRDGRFTLVNKAIAEAYGTTVDGLIGKTDADFNPNRDEVAFFIKKDLEVLESQQERFIPEEKMTDAAGQVRWLQTVKRPMLDDRGRATMVLGASTDITARKGVEQALRRRESDLQAAMAERERISEDLHDGILQSIYAIGLGLEACKPLIAEQPKQSAVKLKTELQRTIGQLNHVLEEVRNFIAGLESHILDGQEFDTVLRTMVYGLAASYSIPCRATVEKTAAQQLSTEQAYHVMNVAREALSNSFRHSHARKIVLSLKCLRRSVRLSVIDNGVGFNPSTIRGTGHGLGNMASRASKIGGNFTLLSKPRGGTKVILDIPKRCADADDKNQASPCITRG